jgi:uncharacterized protein
MIMLDTSFVVAYFNNKDQNHQSAINIAKTLTTQNPEFYITDYIFSEIVTVCLIRLKDIKKAAQIGRLILESCNLLTSQEETFIDAWNMFSTQKLQLSFVDCITIATMYNQNIRKIATFDKDFTKIQEITVL